MSNGLESLETKRPIPVTQPWTEEFWEGTKQGKLLIQTCKDCKTKIFYPRKYCPDCWSPNLEYVEGSGKATVYTFTTTYGMVEPRFWSDLPYTLALVDLEEGIRMMTRIVDCQPQDLRIGMKVEVVFEEVEEFWLPYFRPVRD